MYSEYFISYLSLKTMSIYLCLTSLISLCFNFLPNIDKNITSRHFSMFKFFFLLNSLKFLYHSYFRLLENNKKSKAINSRKIFYVYISRNKRILLFSMHIKTHIWHDVLNFRQHCYKLLLKYIKYSSIIIYNSGNFVLYYTGENY